MKKLIIILLLFYSNTLLADDINVRANLLLVNVNDLFDNESYGVELDYAISKKFTIGPTYNHLAYSGYIKENFVNADYSVAGVRVNYFFKEALQQGFLIGFRAETGSLNITGFDALAFGDVLYGKEKFQRYSLLFSYLQRIGNFNLLYEAGFLYYTLPDEIKVGNDTIQNTEYTGSKNILQFSLGWIF